ncbi:F-box domain - like 10 [Theobroma cacao]|nr:F-box domain - like 10 [Theobroma cacao]
MCPFPSDLITDILCRLPVKTLLRFKCVSKPWGSLIDDSDFVKIHLHQSLKTSTNIKLFLDNCVENDNEAYAVDFDSLCNLVQFPRPFTAEANKYQSRIFGSCNGLLAVCHRQEGIALWNPSTRKYHYLPTLGDDITMDHDILPGCGYDKNTILGFGYDVSNSDYKVVKMFRSKTQNCFKVMIYSLKANSWRRIKDCPYDIFTNYNDGAYVNGSLHWVGDEIDEFFGGVLGGYLCVSRRYSTCSIEEHVNLWVMKEYGVKETWTELLHLSRDEWLTNIFHTRAIAYSRSGEKILLDDGGGCQPAWFNLGNETGETLCILGVPQCQRFSTIIYVESLVSVY